MIVNKEEWTILSYKENNGSHKRTSGNKVENVWKRGKMFEKEEKPGLSKSSKKCT